MIDKDIQLFRDCISKDDELIGERRGSLCHSEGHGLPTAWGEMR